MALDQKGGIRGEPDKPSIAVLPFQNMTERLCGTPCTEFVPDSPLEGAGFEPSVPLAIEGRAQAWNSSLGVTRRILRA